MQPFDLDRFKAGEPAYGKTYNLEYFYLAEMPDGGIVVKYIYDDKWKAFALSIEHLNKNFRMKEKELTWKEVSQMWLSGRPYKPLYEWLDENFEAPKLKKK